MLVGTQSAGRPPLEAHLGAAALGSDYPFGTDGIPYLVREVQEEHGVVVIVEGLEAPPAEETALARLYVGRVATILYPQELPEELRQIVRPQSQVQIAVLRGTASRPEAPPARSIAFLYPPLTQEKAARYGVRGDASGPVFLSVNGQFGIVPATDGARTEAIQAYLSASPKERITWARKYFESQDPVLQRSALLETTVQPRSGEPVLDLCRAALRSDRVSPTNKEVAITSLQNSKADQALEPLQGLALDSNAPLPLRSSAMLAMTSVPGGIQTLNEFRVRMDSPWLRSRSMELLKSHEDGLDKPPSAPSREQVISRLKTGKSTERRQAIEAAGSVGFSMELGDALKTLASDPKERLTVRELAVERLAAFNSRPAAEILSALAKDNTLPKELRSSAIMTIARIETGISDTVLRNLVGSLSDVALKDLAKGLLDQ